MDPLSKLIKTIAKLPGLGSKSAARIAYHLLSCDENYVYSLGSEILEIRNRIHFCKTCGAFAESDECDYCSDLSRDTHCICVVEQPQDISAIEGTREFKGRYHVLGGVIAPLEGKGPEDLNIAGLIQRIQKDAVKELIIATNPTIEGDTTALYIHRLLADKDISVSRLALGLPVGGDLEYADRLTLARAFKGRINL